MEPEKKRVHIHTKKRVSGLQSDHDGWELEAFRVPIQR